MIPCPFCGETPDLPSGDGTQYEIECDCGMACSCVQICDLMTLDERIGDDFVNYRYAQPYIDRARDYAIEQWNKRTPDPKSGYQTERYFSNQRLAEQVNF